MGLWYAEVLLLARSSARDDAKDWAGGMRARLELERLSAYRTCAMLPSADAAVRSVLAMDPVQTSEGKKKVRHCRTGPSQDQAAQE